jgi:hypothetical protein
MRRLPLLLLVSSIAWSSFAMSAAAETVTIGSPLTASFVPSQMCSTICTLANVNLGESGTHLAAPFAGTLVRWRVKDAEGQFRLRVLRPDGAEHYFAVGTSSTESPLGLGVETFPTDLPIQAGDLIGIDNGAGSAKIGEGFGGDVGSSQRENFFPQMAEGTSTSTSDEIFLYLNTEAAFNADVESVPPVIAPISPPTPVATPEQTSPPTPAPTGPPTPTCTVPKLNGRSLKSSKVKIRSADCKVGKVMRKPGAKASTGKVVGQNKKPGTVLPAGTVVNVTLGKG